MVVRSLALRKGRLYPPGNIPSTHFCYRLSRPQDHSAAEIRSTDRNSFTYSLHSNRFCKPLIFPMRCFTIPLTCNGKIKINQSTSSPCPNGPAENIRPEVLDFSHAYDDNARQIKRRMFAILIYRERERHTHTRTHARACAHARTHTHEEQAVNFAHTGPNIHIILAQELSARGPAAEICVACLDFVI